MTCRGDYRTLEADCTSKTRRRASSELVGDRTMTGMSRRCCVLVSGGERLNGSDFASDSVDNFWNFASQGRSSQHCTAQQASENPQLRAATQSAECSVQFSPRLGYRSCTSDLAVSPLPCPPTHTASAFRKPPGADVISQECRWLSLAALSELH
ncbi:hypothetical protein L1887_54227 [Cichorium endivia]|nr:hypothetical protein L1887_54227 [Cichorium endivia]